MERYAGELSAIKYLHDQQKGQHWECCLGKMIMKTRNRFFLLPALSALSSPPSAHGQTFVGINTPAAGINYTSTTGAGASNLSLVVRNGAATCSCLLLKLRGTPSDTVLDIAARLKFGIDGRAPIRTQRPWIEKPSSAEVERCLQPVGHHSVLARRPRSWKNPCCCSPTAPNEGVMLGEFWKGPALKTTRQQLAFELDRWGEA